MGIMFLLSCLLHTTQPSPSTSTPISLRIPHSPINLPQIHPIHLSLRNLTHDPRRPSRHDTKARNHHIRRHNTAIQDPHVVLDDRKLADYHIRPDIDVRPDERRFDDGGGAHEDVVGDFEGVVGELPARAYICQMNLGLEKGVLGRGELPFVQLPRRPQLTTAAEEAVPADCHCNSVPLFLARVASWVCPQ